MSNDIEPVVDIYPYLTPRLQEHVNNLPKELRNIDEDELLEVYTPTTTDRLARQNLWMEYNRAKSTKSNFVAVRIYNGIMSSETFWDRFVKHPHKLAFIIIPPKGYQLMMTNLMDMYLQEMVKICNLPIVSKSGYVDGPLVNSKIKAFSLIKEALYGAAVQRNINVNADISKATGKDDLDQKIAELEAKIKNQVIEVDGEQKKLS